MSEERKTLAGAYAKLEKHEEVCAQRWLNVDFKLNLIFAFMAGAIMIALGAGGWAMSTIISGQQAQLAALQDAKPASR